MMPLLQNQLLATAALFLGLATSRNVPGNVQNFYDAIVAQGQCNNVLASRFHSSDGDSGDFSYCGDHLRDYNVVYIQGKKGQLANLDIDCDGIQGSPADDGRCGSSGDTQSITSFQYELEHYGTGQKDLDANIHPYVVFGNAGTKKNWPTFDPTAYGIKPLSVMAVVCGKKLIYGIWGDENGDDGDEAMVGETSLSLATACFGKSMNGNNGYDPNDVLYIAFPGKDAVPGAKGAKWAAGDYDTFEQSITALGDKLIARIGGHNGTGYGDHGHGGHGGHGHGHGGYHNNGTLYGNVTVTCSETPSAHTVPATTGSTTGSTGPNGEQTPTGSTSVPTVPVTAGTSRVWMAEPVLLGLVMAVALLL